MIGKITDWSKFIIENSVERGEVYIDATMGNGYDTAFLCELAGENGKVYAFDIQQAALDSTQAYLQERGLLSRAELILDSHQEMGAYVKEPVAAICFNFGYLPNGDHQIATVPEVSVAAVEVGLELLKKGGIMSLVIYSGGDTGFAEKEQLLAFVKKLPIKAYDVIGCDFINRQGNSPMPVIIIKK